ncbi:MAG: hypothetical protein CMF61_02905 [Magnetococcales bacterium]|mgnify:CR=1 FL=1|nr:hypothetical protein [Magnetococcales bacterium]PPR19483.1 MAG: hypothetical protein CFH43_00164 [Pseudomonadota bacterium]|tara:strand:+ start:246 stop:653 length:408 start_codon:yes stop_codon:yes gene_type:complete
MRKPLVIDQSQLEKAGSKAADTSQSTGSNKLQGLNNASKVISSSREKWSVPNLRENFDLLDETERALHEARHYMNDILNGDDLYVEMEMTDVLDAQGHVKDKNTGKLVNSYAGTDMLKLYSQNRKERGIIVDGRV